jgi:hypothetical protein
MTMARESKPAFSLPRARCVSIWFQLFPQWLEKMILDVVELEYVKYGHFRKTEADLNSFVLSLLLHSFACDDQFWMTNRSKTDGQKIDLRLVSKVQQKDLHIPRQSRGDFGTFYTHIICMYPSIMFILLGL